MVGGYGILAVVTLFFKYSGYEGCVGMAGCHTLLRMSLKYSN